MTRYWDEWTQSYEIDYTPNYTVIHKGAYYDGETDDDKYYSYDYEDWSDALNEYNGLRGVGVPDVEIRDNNYDVHFADGEWY